LEDIPKPPVRLWRIIPAQLVLVETGSGNPDRSSEGHASSWPQNPGQEPWIASFACDILPLAHGSKEVINPYSPPLAKREFREFSEVRDDHLTQLWPTRWLRKE
jgi:hypothetical protein